MLYSEDAVERDECRFIRSVSLIVECKPEAGHPEEETAAHQDRVQLGAFLLQVKEPALTSVRSVRLLIECVTPVFVCRFQLDHARPNLIWNLKTREELRDALEAEMRSFGVDRELGSASVISWNHQEFEVCVSHQKPWRNSTVLSQYWTF